jgi:hypothetical protein
MFVVAMAGQAKADHHHKAWWKYLKGEWTYEIKELNIKGTATWRLAAKGNALVGRFQTEDGRISIELGGWCSDKKMLVANGYGSEGNYWSLEFAKVTEDTIEGPNCGVLPDGRSYEGTFTGTKISENKYEWTFKGKTGDGEELSMKGTYTRKTEE